MADADVEVETFSVYVGWCKDQVQDDVHQQCTLHLYLSWSTSRRLQLYFVLDDDSCCFLRTTCLLSNDRR